MKTPTARSGAHLRLQNISCSTFRCNDSSRRPVRRMHPDQHLKVSRTSLQQQPAHTSSTTGRVIRATSLHDCIPASRTIRPPSSPQDEVVKHLLRRRFFYLLRHGVRTTRRLIRTSTAVQLIFVISHRYYCESLIASPLYFSSIAWNWFKTSPQINLQECDVWLCIDINPAGQSALAPLLTDGPV